MAAIVLFLEWSQDMSLIGYRPGPWVHFCCRVPRVTLTPHISYDPLAVGSTLRTWRLLYKIYCCPKDNTDLVTLAASTIASRGDYNDVIMAKLTIKIDLWQRGLCSLLAKIKPGRGSRNTDPRLTLMSLRRSWDNVIWSPCYDVTVVYLKLMPLTMTLCVINSKVEVEGRAH